MSESSYKADFLNIELKKNYAIVQLNQGKVNAMNTQILLDLKNTFRAMEADDEIKGSILTGRPHAFSAGLDIQSIARMDVEANCAGKRCPKTRPGLY